jgi:thiol:disulfide interchange protein DsbA
MRWYARLLVSLLALTFAAGAWSQALVEGRDYLRIVPSHATSDPNRIVVTEFFSYHCPHCFAFSQPFKQWSARVAKDVVCRREAVDIGHQAWEPSARTFYALQAMQKLDAVDDAFFGAIHRQHIPLASEGQIAGWLATNGIAEKEFRSAYNSFPVNTQYNRGRQLAVAAKLPSVPTISIDGKYLVVIASNIDFGKQLAVVDALIAKARADKKRS